MHRFALASTLLVTAASPSFAGDWTGAYLGGQIGRLDGKLDDESLKGGIYGVHAGYNHQMGSVVLGGEIDYDFSDAKLDTGEKLDGIGRLKGKLGYDFGPWMAYATAGVAYAQVGGLNDTGTVYGLGVSYMAIPEWIISGEVLQHDFKSFGGAGLSDIDGPQLTLRASYKF